MSAEQTKAFLLEAFDALFNQRDYAKAEPFWSESYIQHSAHIPPGRDGLFNLVRAAPSTLRYENDHIMVEGDWVMMHGRFSGHGRPRAWIACDIVRMGNGRLAEHWDVLQDEATAEESQSGLPMFGTSFAAADQPNRGGSATTAGAPTEFIDAGQERYAYRRFGKADGCPVLFLQHFTGTLDNWDPAFVDRVAAGHDVILFDNAGIGRSSGTVPDTIAGMTAHVFAFLDALGISSCDILGFSLGGMIAQQMVLDRPSIARRLILVGTAPRGGADVMHMEKPRLAKYTQDPQYDGYAVLQKIFFPLSETAQAAGAAFIARLSERKTDLEPPSGPSVAQAQMASFREWDNYDGERFADLKRIKQPTLVMNGVEDDMIAIQNSYWLGEHLPNAVLLTYPDAGHGSLFQYNGPFAGQVAAFLASDSLAAPY